MFQGSGIEQDRLWYGCYSSVCSYPLHHSAGKLYMRHLSICLFTCLIIHLSWGKSVCSLVWLFICPGTNISVHLSDRSSILGHICLSTYKIVHLSWGSSVCSLIWWFTCPGTNLSVHLPDCSPGLGQNLSDSSSILRQIWLFTCLIVHLSCEKSVCSLV